MNIKEKAVIYARVSSKEQEETGYSLAAQKEALTEYAERKGLNIVRVFSIAESATSKQGRLVFTEMLEYTRRQNVTTIICEKIDRLTRTPKDAGIVDDWIREERERAVHFVKESFILNQDTHAHEGLVWNMKVSIAKFYTDNLSEEVKKGQKAKISDGWLPTKPPLGYRTIGDKGKKIHVPDESVAPLLKDMYTEFATGNHTISSIARFIFNKGLRTRGGYKVARSRVHKLLQDPFYHGDFRWKESIYKGQHQPLVTKEIFDKVQDTLHNRNTGKNFKHNYLFKGLIKCHDCGGTVTWEKQKNIVYGHCSVYRECVKRSWYKEETFITAVQEQLDTLKIVQPRLAKWVCKALKYVHADEVGKQDSVIEGLRNRQNRLRQAKSMLYDDRLAERISAEEYDTRVAQTDSDLKSIESAMAAQQRGERSYYELAETILELSQRASDIFATAKPDRQKRLLSLICQENYVENGKLHLKFTEEFRMLKELALQLNSSEIEKPIVSPIQIFELLKDGSSKRQKDPLRSSCSALLPGQDSNLRPID